MCGGKGGGHSGWQMILGSAAVGGAKRYANDFDGIGWQTGGKAMPCASQQPLGVHSSGGWTWPRRSLNWKLSLDVLEDSGNAFFKSNMPTGSLPGYSSVMRRSFSQRSNRSSAIKPETH